MATLPPLTPRSPGGKTLVQRRQERHSAALDGFQSRCRQIGEQCDGTVESLCHTLRANLALSYEDSEKLLHQTSQQCERDDAGLVDELEDLVVAKQLDAHALRRHRITRLKTRLRDVLKVLQRLSAARLAAIDDCGQAIRAVEADRRGQLEHSFADLLTILSEIAFTTQQQSALTVERVAERMNESLLENQGTTLELLQRLKSSELVRQKEIEQRFARTYRRTQLRAATFVRGECKARFDAGRFRNPEHREELLRQLQTEYRAFQDFLLAQIEGISQLSMSLDVVKASEGCIIGGTHQGGWLHTRESAVQLMDQWKAELGVTSERLAAVQTQATEKAISSEGMLVRYAKEEMQMVEQDLVLILLVEVDDEHVERVLREMYEAEQREAVEAQRSKYLALRMEAEQAVLELAERGLIPAPKKQANAGKKGKIAAQQAAAAAAAAMNAIPPPEVMAELPEHLRNFYLHPPIEPQLMPYEKHCEELARSFVQSELGPLLEDIEYEGKGFCAALHDALHVQSVIVDQLLYSELNSLIPMFTSAAKFLMQAASGPPSWESNFLRTMASKEQQFIQRHEALERDLGATLELIRGSKDGKECGDLTARAMALLTSISTAYADSYKDRLGIVDPYMEEMTTKCTALLQRLLKGFHLQLLSDVEAEEKVELDALLAEHAKKQREVEMRLAHSSGTNGERSLAGSAGGRKRGKGGARGRPQSAEHDREEDGQQPTDELQQLRDQQAAELRQFLSSRRSVTNPRLSTRRGTVVVCHKTVKFSDLLDFGEHPPDFLPPQADPVLSQKRKRKQTGYFPGKDDDPSTGAGNGKKGDKDKGGNGTGKQAGGSGRKGSASTRRGLEEGEPEALTEEQIRELEEREAADVHAQRIGKARQRFDLFVTRYCTPDAVLQEDHIHQIYVALRQHMVNWMEGLRETFVGRASVYCRQKKEELPLWLSVKQRDHQRRPADVETGVVMARMRELQDISEDMRKQSHWLNQRVTHGLELIDHELQRTRERFTNHMQDMDDRRNRLYQTASMPALEAHNRDTISAVDAIKAATKQDFVHLNQMAEALQTSFAGEVHRMLAVRVSNLAGRRDKSMEEAIQALQEELTKGLQRVHLLKEHLLEIRTQQDATTSESLESFTRAFHHNLEDLAFLHAIQEVAMQCKGSIATVIAGSLEAERQLALLIQELEDELKKPSRRLERPKDPIAAITNATPDASFEAEQWDDYFTHAVQSLRLQSASSSSATGNITAATSPTTVSVTGGAVGGTNPFQGTTAHRLLDLLDRLRRSLYARGLFLGALRCRAEPKYVPPPFYIEGPPSAGQNPATAAMGSPKPPAKGRRSSKPVTLSQRQQSIPDANTAGGMATVLMAPPRGWDEFAKTAVGEVRVREIVKKAVDKVTGIVRDFYTVKAASQRAITRPALILPTEQGSNERVRAKLHSLAAAYQKHLYAGQSEYRRQVARVHVTVHQLPQDVYNGVFNVGIANAIARSAVVRGHWASCREALQRARLKHGSSLKGSQNNPSSSALVKGVAAAEAARQDAALRLVGLFNALALREEADEVDRLVPRLQRVCSTMFTLFESLVTPDMLAAPEKASTMMLRLKQWASKESALSGGGGKGKVNDKERDREKRMSSPHRSLSAPPEKLVEKEREASRAESEGNTEVSTGGADGIAITTGKHRSLKRLLKQRQKEEMHQAQVVGTPATDRRPTRVPKPPAAVGANAVTGKSGNNAPTTEDITAPLPMRTGVTRITFAGIAPDQPSTLQLLLKQQPDLCPDLPTARALLVRGAPQTAGSLVPQPPQQPDSPSRKSRPARAGAGRAASPQPKAGGGVAADSSLAPFGDKEYPTTVFGVPVGTGAVAGADESLAGPDERIFHDCVMERNSCFSAFRAIHTSQCAAINEYFRVERTAEVEWVASFSALLAALVPDPPPEVPKLTLIRNTVNVTPPRTPRPASASPSPSLSPR